MKAALQFLEYHVVEAVYMFNPFTDAKSNELSPEFEFSLDLNPETKLDAWITLAISMGDKSLESQEFYIRGKIMGRFMIRSDNELTDEQIMDLYKINAVAILYPYLRSLVSDLSSKGSRPPIILPTMNIVAMMEKAEREKYSLDDNGNDKNNEHTE
ncbi:protein-export chaperone SecB [Bacillaceae bacterium]